MYNLSQCDLVMYTLQGILVVPVKYSEEFAENMVSRAETFIDHKLSQSCCMDTQVLQLAKFPSDLVRLLFAAVNLYKVDLTL